MRSPTFKSIVACLVFSLSTACVYVPPVWDAVDEIHDVDQIREGVTTKAEVLALLGAPDFENRDDRKFKYEGQSSAGFAIIVNRGGLVNPKSWSICILFDEYDVVRYVDVPCRYRDSIARQKRRVELEAERRVRCNMPFSEAIQLDAATQYDLGTICPRMGSDPQTDALGWRWMCLAANQKHPLAQHVMGIFYKEGGEPVSQDLVRAYIWYRLAEVNGVEEFLSGRGRYVKTATGWKCCSDGKPRREAVIEQLTPAQIAEAERLVAEWEPNPAECEINSVESNVP